MSQPIYKDIEDKFIPEPNSGCWLWIAAQDPRGYGRVNLLRRTGLRNRVRLAHRVVYEMYRGPIPKGLTLDHLCRVTSCVNPNHLEITTLWENQRRGMSLNAQNARKTHCMRGHEFTERNAIREGRTGRRCRICTRAHEARRRLP